MSIFRRLTEKPWVETDDRVERLHTKLFRAHDRKVALYIFLCVVGSVFFLLFAATHMRIALATDWVPMPEPILLWVNSVVLVAVSMALEYSRRLVNSNQDGMFVFSIGGVLTFLFLGLQIVVWWQLIALGYAAQRNPSNAFFYVLTALHAAHLIGGLIAWCRALWRMRSKDGDYPHIRLSVELCAIYWHFLLLVWVVVLALFVST
ncbi:MAG: cytochrome-c oxidase [Gammaproteobacteria bacterium]|nr:cytochrome-c oxidase [Gammaproteobacteria bacterium]